MAYAVGKRAKGRSKHWKEFSHLLNDLSLRTVMLTSRTETGIYQAIMMQENLHSELRTNTYHLEGKFIFLKRIQRER